MTSPQPTTPKKPLTLLYALFIVIAGGVLWWWTQVPSQIPSKEPLPEGAELASSAGAVTPLSSSSKKFMGIREVSSEALCDMMPTTGDRSQLLHFSSKYCHDCQKLKPVLEEALPHYPTVTATTLDIQFDRDRYARIFKAFQPTIVPVMVMISPTCDIQNVLYGYQSESTVRHALEILAQ